MIILKNADLTVAVKRHGAELASIRAGEREYLWQADPEFWSRHSPVLFPIVGSIYDKTYRVNGVEHPMGQHGFARDYDFEVVTQSDTEVWLAFDSSEATRELFPFDFHLEIGYRLEGRTVNVMWCVQNPSDVELPFQIGAHPAFYWPEHDAESLSWEGRGFFAFDAPGPLHSRKLIGKGCVDPEETFPVVLDKRCMLPLTATTFDELDTFIFERQVNRVTLCDMERQPVLSVRFQHPVVGLWSPPGRRAPFVCVEPWYGRCDSYGYAGEFRDREWVNRLQPGEQFDSTYIIEIA